MSNTRTPTYNDEPTGETPMDVDMLRKEWASGYLVDKEMGRDIVNSYLNKGTLPGPRYLAAIAKALGVEKTDLLPTRLTKASNRSLMALDVRDAGDGRAWLRVNQAVDWPLALKIMQLLKSDK